MNTPPPIEDLNSSPQARHFTVPRWPMCEWSWTNQWHASGAQQDWSLFKYHRRIGCAVLDRLYSYPFRACGALAMNLARSMLLAAGLLCLSASLPAEATWVSVKPSETDPQIHRFDTPHWICVNREILLDQRERGQDRHQLLLFLPGTNGHGRGAKAFLETAANLGYHCIELMYPDDVAAAEVCRNDPDPKSYQVFRWAVITGGVSPHLTIDRVDSIEHRLLLLLLTLHRKRPREDWGQFMRGNEIAWDRIAVAGQSQGGGHAGLIGVRHHVARVIMFGAPKDYSRARRQPATWYSEPKATPVEAFFAINHRQDRVGCSFDEVLQSLHVLPPPLQRYPDLVA